VYIVQLKPVRKSFVALWHAPTFRQHLAHMYMCTILAHVGVDEFMNELTVQGHWNGGVY